MKKLLHILFCLIPIIIMGQPHPGYNGNGDPAGGDPIGGGAPVGGMLIPFLVYGAIYFVVKYFCQSPKEKENNGKY